MTRGSLVDQRPALAALCLGLLSAAMVMTVWLAFVAAFPGMIAFSLGRLAWKDRRPFAVTSMVLGAVGILASAILLPTYLTV